MKVRRAMSEAKEEILNIFPITNQTAKALKTSKGKSTAIAPAPVAIPLPPSKKR